MPVPDLLDDQLAPDESVRRAAAGESTAVAVTDRRIVRATGVDQPGDATVRSTLLVGPHVTGVMVDRSSPDPPLALLLLGILSAIFGVGFGGGAGVVSGASSAIFGALAAFGLAGGVLLLVAAALKWAGSKDSVRVVVEYVGEETSTVSLAGDVANVATEAVIVAGEAREESAAG